MTSGVMLSESKSGGIYGLEWICLWVEHGVHAHVRELYGFLQQRNVLGRLGARWITLNGIRRQAPSI
jgi:hypothetical protein